MSLDLPDQYVGFTDLRNADIDELKALLAEHAEQQQRNFEFIARHWPFVRRTECGIVDSTGAILGGSGFSVNRTGAGLYDVTFAVPFAAEPAVTAITSTIGSVRLPSLGGGSLTLVSFSTENNLGVPGDAQFTFIAAAV